MTKTAEGVGSFIQENQNWKETCHFDILRHPYI